LRRRVVHRVATFDLAGVVVLAAASLALGWRRGALPVVWRALRRTGPFALAFAAYAGIAGGWLASSYEAGNATPFWAIGTTTLLLGLLARAWGAVGSKRSALRVARAVLCASSVVAAGFLVLERIDVNYLQGFGL
jgi:heme/copper-type cytochrome/quinol oxidase subunit 3